MFFTDLTCLSKCTAGNRRTRGDHRRRILIWRTLITILRLPYHVQRWRTTSQLRDVLGQPQQMAKHGQTTRCRRDGTQPQPNWKICFLRSQLIGSCFKVPLEPHTSKQCLKVTKLVFNSLPQFPSINTMCELIASYLQDSKDGKQNDAHNESNKICCCSSLGSRSFYSKDTNCSSYPWEKEKESKQKPNIMSSSC